MAFLTNGNISRLKTNKFLEDIMLKELLSDIISVEDVLLVVKSNGATSEMRSNSLNIRQKDQWITIGDNDVHVTCMLTLT